MKRIIVTICIVLLLVGATFTSNEAAENQKDANGITELGMSFQFAFTLISLTSIVILLLPKSDQVFNANYMVPLYLAILIATTALGKGMTEPAYAFQTHIGSAVALLVVWLYRSIPDTRFAGHH